MAAAIVLAYACTIAVYRLFFHPLAKYPGPKLAAITNWYPSFYAYRGDYHLKNRAWHDQYGDIVRAGPNTLWFNTRDALNDIYGIRANVRKVDAWAAYSASRRSPNVLSAIDKNVHSFKRRTLAAVFSQRGMNEIESRILEHVEKFTDLLGTKDDSPSFLDASGWRSPKLMTQVCDWLSFDIIGDITYGKSFDMLRSPDLRWVPSVYSKMSHRGMACLAQPKVWQYKVDRIFLAPMYKDIVSAGTWVYERAKARVGMGDNVETNDAFSIMMNAKDEKRGLEYSLKDLWTESMLLLAAGMFPGTDTTSATMSALFFYLVHDRNALERLAAEVRAAFSSEDEIRPGPELNSCTFLQACINETMRLIPAVPNGSPRCVLPGGLKVGDEIIPEGTTVATSLYVLMRRSDYFHNPDEFRPWRFVVDPAAGVDEESVQAAHQAFVPFGIGPRSCVGWKLGWTELNLALARTLFLYDMRLAPGARCCATNRSAKNCEYHFKGWSIAYPSQGASVQFKKRQ
ncbi:hypothetical protein N7478_009882 [Penicillium angulare]|uniref:uncharacterized protein n=1 Tax=Penicillium angulare TaxID=116970 RepID=UPI00253F8413|nr:uncharacterized protein N7478_009882 [Penicillium angulare]KAJ5267074.1 hypothetical protein N7478_009882 [Penicillium angulare]